MIKTPPNDSAPLSAWRRAGGGLRTPLPRAEAVRVAAIMIRPFLPCAAERIYAGFNYPTPFEQASYEQIAARPGLGGQ